MRIVKQRLLEMLPDIHAFLDVDDLREGKGAEYVDASCLTLVFVSDGYFESPNCMRELLRAVATQKPIVALVELEEKHGALSRAQVQRPSYQPTLLTLTPFTHPLPVPPHTHNTLTSTLTRRDPILSSSKAPASSSRAQPTRTDP